MTDFDKISSLAKRDVERKSDLAQRKATRDLLTANNEKLDYFELTFTQELTKIARSIEKSKEIDKEHLADHFDAIAKQILTLQKYVAASNIFLRTYDIKKCQEALQEVSVQSKLLENELLPKKKFGFKKKKHPKASGELNKPKDEADLVCKPIKKSFYGFFDRTGEDLTFGQEEICRKDVCLENLTNCTVKLYGSPSTLHINNLKGCKIFTGPVSTSIFVDNCHNTTLVIACQQLRLHSSTNLTIYLHVTSRAIMEDCSDVYITPYNWNYPKLEEDFKISNLDPCTNHFEAVDDFNWLKIDEKSPNWSVLDDHLVETWDV